MADRYWVGGSGSWNSTTKWSTTSGGASGASVPTASDNAIFDANSSAAHYTVTVTDNATCADLTFTPVAVNGATIFLVSNGFAVTGTFSTTGTQGNRRMFVRGNTSLQRDMSIGTIGSVSDVDFERIRITGTGGALSGTRIGSLFGNINVSPSAPKTVYRIGTGNWVDDEWSNTSGGAVDPAYFPLPQDTAVIDESTTGGTHTLSTAIPYAGSIDMSGRTSSLTLAVSGTITIVGNVTFGTGIVSSGTSQVLTFAGDNTQTLTMNGVTLLQKVLVDTVTGGLELGSALTFSGAVAADPLEVRNGTFDTKSYNITGRSFNSSNSNVRTVRLGASTITLSQGFEFLSTTRLTFDAGTSHIICTGAGDFEAGGLTLYDVSLTSTAATTGSIAQKIRAGGTTTFRNLTIAAPSSPGLKILEIQNSPLVVTGTFSVTGSSPTQRVLFAPQTTASSIGPRITTLDIETLSADDCDFYRINLTGTAINSAPARAGDLGGNSGITFPAPKTVYWNLAGTQNWSATGWATTSGGVPAANNFPLAQDTAVFDDAGSAGTVTFDSYWNITTMDASARTTAMTLTLGTGVYVRVFGDWLFGTGVTSGASTGTLGLVVAPGTTNTITSNGVTFGNRIIIRGGNGWNSFTETGTSDGKVELADALVLDSARSLNISAGIFDALTYNVTVGSFGMGSGEGGDPFSGGSGAPRRVRMGSGTWTVSGTGAVWSIANSTLNVLEEAAPELIFSNTSTSGRSFTGGSNGYKKVTIGGATGTSTFTFSDNLNYFEELASTKTVAHTIAFGSSNYQVFGKWSVTGSLGNVVTLTGTASLNEIYGDATSGIDYLNIGSVRFASYSPGEFYAGANSTAASTPAAPTYLADKPADSTRYWVGGTGNWSDTNMWSTTSGGAGGASVPRSHDDVVFDSSSNATSYTATRDTVTGGARCKSLTLAGPASGDLTLAGGAQLFIHGSLSTAASGVIQSSTGIITFSGSGTGNTIDTGGLTFREVQIYGIGADFTLASAFTGLNTFRINAGTFDTGNYNLTLSSTAGIITGSAAQKIINLGSSTITIGDDLNLNARNLTINSGTSTISITNGGRLSSSFPFTYTSAPTLYDVEFGGASGTLLGEIFGSVIFNNLTLKVYASQLQEFSIQGNQVINGTFTVVPASPANASHRVSIIPYVQTGAIAGRYNRTLTCAAVNLTDADFIDITIDGAAAPASGTRLGDCGGNSGIVFDSPKTVYWNYATGGNIGQNTATWALTSGGTPDVLNFPLAQDTAIFENTGLNTSASITINQKYNLGSLDMSSRTNAMTIAMGSTGNARVCGSWSNSSSVTISGTLAVIFSGRGSHTVTTSGRNFNPRFVVDCGPGTLALQDALNLSQSVASVLNFLTGTFECNGYNVTMNQTNATTVMSTTTGTTPTVDLGSGSFWVIRKNTSTALSFNNTSGQLLGTGTFSFTGTGSRTATITCSGATGLTVDQATAGTLTLNARRLADITASYTATGATTISLGTNTIELGQFTGKGEAGKLLTLTGTAWTFLNTSGTGPFTDPTVDYLVIQNGNAIPASGDWYAGDNSVNLGNTGWFVLPAPPAVPSNFFLLFI